MLIGFKNKETLPSGGGFVSGGGQYYSLSMIKYKVKLSKSQADLSLFTTSNGSISIKFLQKSSKANCFLQSNISQMHVSLFKAKPHLYASVFIPEKREVMNIPTRFRFNFLLTKSRFRGSFDRFSSYHSSIFDFRCHSFRLKRSGSAIHCQRWSWRFCCT
jgi:hypothetical protein